MLTAGTLRACWSIGLAFVRPGTAGLVLVIAVELGLVTCMGVFNPVFATYRLEQHRARPGRPHPVRLVGHAASATVAALTALWGVLAALTGPRTAIAVAGVLLLATPLLLLGGECDRETEPANEPLLTGGAPEPADTTRRAPGSGARRAACRPAARRDPGRGSGATARPRAAR